ncbi:MAG: adenosylcobinamide amidohydrolase [Methanomassiliicoccales archaeon]
MNGDGFGVEYHEVEGFEVAVIDLPRDFRFLSSAVMNGGLHSTDRLVIMQVPKNYDEGDPAGVLTRVGRRLGVPNALGFMTAAKIGKVLTVERAAIDDVSATTVVTAGLSNAVVAGERFPMYTLAHTFEAGTINTISVIEAGMSDTGRANAMITVTEAKTAALRDLGVEATGTTTDSVAVGSLPGEIDYAGPATDVGLAVSQSVRRAVSKALQKNGDGPRPTDFVMRLEEKGVHMDDIWLAAKELYSPHPDWDEEEVRERFESLMNGMREDVNVNAMVEAAVLLDERGHAGRLFGLTGKQFEEDPVHLLADEMIAMSLSQYIAGTRGLFEYTRYDRKKPGILGELDPFLDDAVACLIGSLMSRIYTELLGGSV